MAKKIDLMQKTTNDNFSINKNTHPTNYNEEPVDDIENEETTENVASTTNENINPRQNAINTIKDFNENTTTNEKIEILMKNPVTRKVILALIPIVIGLLFIVYIIMVISGSDNLGGMATSGYYTPQCEEITVIFTNKNNNYEVTGTATYDLETYVAGVISGEVGFFGNLEVDKAFAIAARSYVLTRESNCTIESSDRYQVFREPTGGGTDLLAIQAANETKGQVLLSNNRLTSTQYDAFACIAKDDNYYTVSQANQKLPISWVESKINPNSMPAWFICDGKENLRNHHGNGMSQYGSLYLATELGYDYKQILNFYLGDKNITISTKGFVSSIANLEIKNTTKASELHTPLGNYLNEKGSSIEDLNNFIYSNVQSNGSGTRAGVVTAAVSIVNYLYDNLNVRIPYYWGGNYQHIGVNPSFGGRINSSVSRGGSVYSYSGFDCSGFVSWAIKNGGYKMSRLTTQSFHNAFSNDSCSISNQSCIGQPGDLINSASCHVQMIVSVDEANGKYYIAESTGSLGLIIRPVNMHSSNCGNAETRILHMDNFYNKSSNVDTNY